MLCSAQLASLTSNDKLKPGVYVIGFTYPLVLKGKARICVPASYPESETVSFLVVVEQEKLPLRFIFVCKLIYLLGEIQGCIISQAKVKKIYNSSIFLFFIFFYYFFLF